MKSIILTKKEKSIANYIGTLSIEPTRRCNMNCDFCVRGKAQNVNISHEIIDKTLGEMDGIYIHEIRLSGGEPFLAVDEIDYLIDEIIRRKIIVTSMLVFTNGTVRSERIVNTFKKRLHYFHSVKSEFEFTQDWINSTSYPNYKYIAGKAISVIASTYGHDIAKSETQKTIDYYNNAINDDDFIIVSQSDAYWQDVGGIVIEGNAVENFDKVFSERRISPDEISVNDNYFSFIKQIEKDNKAIGYFVSKTLTVSANGNVFPGAAMPYLRVDQEKMFNILECNGDFLQRVNSFCWKHPLNREANSFIRRFKAIEFCLSRGKQVEKVNRITHMEMVLFYNYINKLEQVMKDMHKILPYLDFAGIQSIATATVILDLFNSGVDSNLIKEFAKICTVFNKEEDIKRLSPEWCRGFILFMSEKNNELARSAAQQ